MTKCAHCNKRKGKRTCPALAGLVCPQCCGAHRLRDISCPSDCSWLGGLAVVAGKSEVDPEATKRAYVKAYADFEAWCHRGRGFGYGNLAAEALFDDEPTDEEDAWLLPLMMATMLYGVRDDDDKRLVDRYLAERARFLTVEEAAALDALRGAWASLFEIERVSSGLALVMRDLADGSVVEVREVSLTAQVKPGDLMYAWVMSFGPWNELTGGACLVPPAHRAAVVGAYQRALADARDELPGKGHRELSSVLCGVAPNAVRRCVRSWVPPRMVNHDGDEIVLSRASFRVADEAAVLERLDGLLEREEGERAWTWLAERERTALGRVTVVGGKLTLEVNSRERLSRGRALLEGALGALVAHELDAHEDIAVAMERARREGASRPPPPSDIPDEVQREVVGQLLAQHYATWLDEPLPALEGKTPRAAAQTEVGKRQVRALLDDIEHGTARMPGGEAVDFRAMRREIGLVESDNDHDDGDGFDLDAYDPARAPDPAQWLAAAEGDRFFAVERYHERSRAPHPALPSSHGHAAAHVIVENWLAAGDPPAARRTLERLLGVGLTRHEAVHAIGSVAMEEMTALLNEQRPFDRARLERRLGAVAPDDYCGSAP